MPADDLAGRLAAAAPMTVAEYMEQCAARYYATRDPFGAGGDFTTAPEISQIFGEILGAWIADQWARQGRPSPCALLELGPGRGTLMKDMLRATRHVPGFHAAVHILMLEASPVLQALQRRTLQGIHPHIRWMEDAGDLPSLPLFWVANEFFDALPVRQFVGEAERRIGWNGVQFHFTPEGAVTKERCEAGERIMGALAAHMARYGGAGLAVDYGYTQGGGDTLQAVRGHAYANPLETPGEADLTAHVDFSALARAAETAGRSAHIEPQGAFLKRHGAELRATQLCKNATPAQREEILSGLERLVSPAQMGELFKVLTLC